MKTGHAITGPILRGINSNFVNEGVRAYAWHIIESCFALSVGKRRGGGDIHAATHGGVKTSPNKHPSSAAAQRNCIAIAR